MSKRNPQHNKSIIETLVNTVALALTSYGVVQITSGQWDGYVAISFGMLLEFFKYSGRDRKLW